MKKDFEQIYEELFRYCENENFAGFDPFDGLNSRIFQRTFLRRFALPRLVWLQTVKRSPKNLRPLLRIEKGVNAKGIALFALAEISRFRVTRSERHAETVEHLLKKLAALKIDASRSGARNAKIAFGYNFDWQSRAFFAPRGTPTIVPTAFAASAFAERFEIFQTDADRQILEGIGKFIVEDLNRPFESESEVCFSYTPLDKSVIFNASLLAGETLARVGEICGNKEYLGLAEKSARFVLKRQQANGSWAYGAKFRHAWIDNFHTAYILLSLFRLRKIIPELKEEADRSIAKGLDFWLENFFLEDGTPKYYDRQTFPIDIHSAAAAIVALSELCEFDSRCLRQAERVARWTLENMRDRDAGFFFYQKTKSRTIETSFIRWSNAWMAFALAKLLEESPSSGENFE